MSYFELCPLGRNWSPNTPPSNSIHTELLYPTVFQDILEELQDLLAVFFSPEATALGLGAFVAVYFLLRGEQLVQYLVETTCSIKSILVQLLANLELKTFLLSQDFPYSLPPFFFPFLSLKWPSLQFPKFFMGYSPLDVFFTNWTWNRI